MLRYQASVKNSPTSWIDWWNSEAIVEEITWQKNMQHFIESTTSLLNYNIQDIVLDIGCGPGYLADMLKNSVKEIHCLDTSEHYIAICQDKFKNKSNIFIHQISCDRYTDFKFLDPGKFSLIICLSVIQYYKSYNDVNNLIHSVKRIASPHSKFLIADIPLMTNKLEDTAVLLRSALLNGRLHETIKFLWRLMFSQYGKSYSTLGLLRFSHDQLYSIIDHHHLSGEIITKQLTANTNRAHMLIDF